MWWNDIRALPARLRNTAAAVDPSAWVAPDAVLAGAVEIGPRSRICAGARIEGPVSIGADCLVGNHAFIRANTWIGDGCRIGFAVEMKQAWLGERVSTGPQCYVADSWLEDAVYLGAQVRTSNHRLDQQSVRVMTDEGLRDTGMDKLGCWIGARASLGIQVIVLPGRRVLADTLLGPRITVTRNLPSGRYQLRQAIESF